MAENCSTHTVHETPRSEEADPKESKCITSHDCRWQELIILFVNAAEVGFWRFLAKSALQRGYPILKNT